MIKRIITHDGIFHADDAMAIALLLEYVDSNAEVLRTREIPQDDIQDPKVWIVDVGLRYDPQKRLFDHHQDKVLPSACKIILMYLVAIKKVNVNQYNELKNAINSISEIDCKGYKNDTDFVFNHVIKSFNTLDDGWDIALKICRDYIKSRNLMAVKAIESKSIWDAGESIGISIRICESYPSHWKKYNEQEVLVYNNNEKWYVISRNVSTYPLSITGKEDFMHVNNFIASYKNKEDAIECAKKTCGLI